MWPIQTKNLRGKTARGVSDQVARENEPFCWRVMRECGPVEKRAPRTEAGFAELNLFVVAAGTLVGF